MSPCPGGHHSNSDHQPVQHVTNLAGGRFRQFLKARQVRKRLQHVAGQQPGLLLTKLPQPPAQGSQLGAVHASDSVSAQAPLVRGAGFAGFIPGVAGRGHDDRNGPGFQENHHEQS